MELIAGMFVFAACAAILAVYLVLVDGGRQILSTTIRGYWELSWGYINSTKKET